MSQTTSPHRPNNKSRRQNRLFVDRSFQYRFTLKLCLISGILFALFTGVSLLLIRLNYQVLMENALLQMPEIRDKLRSEYTTLSLAMAVNWALFIACMFLFGAYYTKRVAGPIYALKRRLQGFIESRSTARLKIRTTDEFQNLAHLYNKAMETVESDAKK